MHTPARHRGRLSRWPALPLLVGALLSAGCQTAPDIRPFADATSQLSGSIRTAGRTVTDEINILTVSWPQPQHDAAMKLAGRFEEQWAPRGKLADALSTYSSSLADIVASGEQGEKSALAVADSFKKLTAALDVVPIGAAASTVVDAGVSFGAYLYGKYARDRAAKTLAGAMTEVQPFIDEAASVLRQDFDSIRTGLQNGILAATPNSVDQIDMPSTGKKVGDERGRLKARQERLVALEKTLGGAQPDRDKARAAVVNLSAADLAASPIPPPVAAARADLERWSALTDDILHEMETLKPLIAQSQTLLAPYDQELSTRQDRIRTEIEMVTAVREGLAVWADTHAKLADAAKQKHPPSVEELVDAAQRIRELVNTVKHAKGNP